MAKIGPVKLKVDVQGATAVVDVEYEIEFDTKDQTTNQTYAEDCRLIGDDTNANDPPALAGPDDTLGFLTPMFNKHTQANGAPSATRHFNKTFRTADLDEDRGPVPNPDELRARVTLTPVSGGGKPVHRESPMVKKRI